MPSLLRGTLIRCNLPAGELDFHRDMATRAHESLLLALRIADETEILRPFLDAGPTVLDHLVAATDRSGRRTEVACRIVDLVTARTAGQVPLLFLTPTEASILRDLPSLLKYRQIAAARSVSTNTVKTHVRAMHRKLGVSSRHQAVEVARAQGLL